MFILKVPNADTTISGYTVCPKAIMQKAWVDKVGSCIDWCGESTRVLSVIITDDEIIIKMNKDSNI
jgi:hypothetical protein